MKRQLRKLLLSCQSDYPVIVKVKDRSYATVRRCLRVPHEHEFNVLRLIPPSLKGCYIDIGANRGQSIQSILLFKPSEEIVSFEPNPLLAEQLEVRYRNCPNIWVIAKGLSDEVGTFSLFVPKYKRLPCYDLASLSREAAETWINQDRVFGFDPSKLQVSEVQCSFSKLDLYGLSPIFIKIDVQGAEYNVLAGARETLQRCEPIVVVEDYRGNPKTVQLMEGLGYEEVALEAGVLRRGRTHGDNSLLITASRMRDLSL
jgi:FkbM family methyltransferase